MHVLATAGHVDHGKSTLIHALTGMEPDRLAEEHRRQLTIELGFAWMSLPDRGEIAFVDVPGHERFVPTMLAGVGSVPAVLFVVGADEGWMPQSTEHLEALDALGVSHGVLVVTRADLADSGRAIAEAREMLVPTSLGRIPQVTVSAVTGSGLGELREAIGTLSSSLPAGNADAPVRLWLDRSFSVHGAGTVVTGTLDAGIIRAGDELVTSTGRPVRVRGLQALGRHHDVLTATARVAVNLREVSAAEVPRGTALLTPGAWSSVDTVDVRVRRLPAGELPGHLMLHLGTLAVPCRLRPLDGEHARLRLDRRLPLHVGDRGLLRDPGRHRVVAGVDVLDVEPPPLDKRGAARVRGIELRQLTDETTASAHVLRRRPRRGHELHVMGLPATGERLADDWWATPERWDELAAKLVAVVGDWRADHPLDTGMPIAAAQHRLDLPATSLVGALAERSGLAINAGLLAQPGARTDLPRDVGAAVAEVESDLRTHPFHAPVAERLADLGLDAARLAAAERAGRLIRVADGVVLLPDAPYRAYGIVAHLPQPFTLSQARQALDTSRRVAVPLLELMAARGLTRRTPDGRHETVSNPM